MRIRDKILALLCGAALAVTSVPAVTPALAAGVDLTDLIKNKDLEDSYSAGATVVELGAEGAVVDSASVTVEGQTVTITAKGDYVLRGTWQGQVVVEVPESDKVHLILDGVTIEAVSGPAIYEKQSDKLIVSLAEGSDNTLTCTTAITDGDDTISAALYAEDDLTINGTGALSAQSSVGHGVQSKADLKIISGTLTVSAAKDGIRGRNSVLITGGDIQVTAEGDGIVTTRDDREDKGYIIIAGGVIDITTGGGAGETTQAAQTWTYGQQPAMEEGGMPEPPQGTDGQMPEPPQDMNGQMPGQRMDGGSFGGRGGMNSRGGRQGGNWGWMQEGNAAKTESGVSSKGIKATATLTIQGGQVTIDSQDDALHAKNIDLVDGTLTLASVDDGAHADESLTVSGGVIRVTTCYEGLEGTNVTISGGDIEITSSDDGVNAAGGSDNNAWGGWGGWGGQDGFSADSGMLTVTGGRLIVTAGGDALDSNGSISLTGGVIGLWCATTTGEGAIDFNGTGELNGATMVIASTGGVMSDTARLSGQTTAAITLNQNQAAGAVLTLTDASGSALLSFAPGNAYSTVYFTYPGLAEGTQCAVTCGNASVFSGAVTSSMISAASSGTGWGGGWGGMGGGMGGGGRGGWR